MLIMAVIADSMLIWGILCLYWFVPSLFSGQVNFIESLSRDTNPVYFWIVLLLWFSLSIYMVWADLFFGLTLGSF